MINEWSGLYETFCNWAEDFENENKREEILNNLRNLPIKQLVYAVNVLTMEIDEDLLGDLSYSLQGLFE